MTILICPFGFLLITVGVAASSRVVYPQLLESRGSNGEKFLRVEEGLTLKLQKAPKVLAHELIVRRSLDGEKHEVVNAALIQSTLYHDEENMASVALHERPTGVEVSGILGRTLRIKPLRSSPGYQKGMLPHRLYSVDASSIPDDTFGMPVERLRGVGSNVATATEAKVAKELTATEQGNGSTLPESITFELMLVHSSGFGKHLDQRFSNDVAYYDALFFSSVNQRFRNIRGTRIRFLIVEMVRLNATEDEKVFEFYNGRGSNVLEAYYPRRNGKVGLSELKGKKIVNATASLPKLKKYVKNMRNGSKVDVVFFLTEYMTFYKDPNTRDDDRPVLFITPGDSYQGGICTENKVAIAEDSGLYFEGIDNAARVLARLMGATYDQKRGQKGCNYYDNYLMGTFWSKEDNHYFLSKCSADALKKHLQAMSSTARKKCFKRSYPTSVSDNYSRLLPGKIYDTVEDYCRLVVQTHDKYKVYACTFKSSGDFYELYFRNCEIRCCVYWGAFYWFLESGPHNYVAPDGMPCGYRKACINKQCVQDPGVYV